MSKTALVIVAVVVVLVVLYRRGLARKKLRIEAEIETEILAANALPRTEVARYNPSASEILTSDEPARVSTTITKEEYDALPVAKTVNLETGVITSSVWGGRSGRRGGESTATREEVAAMQPIVYSSPTATRGNYRTAL